MLLIFFWNKSCSFTSKEDIIIFEITLNWRLMFLLQWLNVDMPQSITQTDQVDISFWEYFLWESKTSTFGNLYTFGSGLKITTEHSSLSEQNQEMPRGTWYIGDTVQWGNTWKYLTLIRNFTRHLNPKIN